MTEGRGLNIHPSQICLFGRDMSLLLCTCMIKPVCPHGKARNFLRKSWNGKFPSMCSIIMPMCSFLDELLYCSSYSVVFFADARAGTSRVSESRYMG